MSGKTSETSERKFKSAAEFWREYYRQDPNFPPSEAACKFAEAYADSRVKEVISPTPPEGEAVPEQAKLAQNLSFLEAAPDEVARMDAAIADKYMRYAAPVVSTAAPEPPDARKAVEDWFKLPHHDLEFRHQSDLCEGTNIIDVACTFCRIITAMAAYACDKSKPNPVAPESYKPAEEEKQMFGFMKRQIRKTVGQGVKEGVREGVRQGLDEVMPDLLNRVTTNAFIVAVWAVCKDCKDNSPNPPTYVKSESATGYSGYTHLKSRTQTNEWCAASEIWKLIEKERQ